MTNPRLAFWIVLPLVGPHLVGPGLAGLSLVGIAAAQTAPKAAPVTGVQQVAPFAAPMPQPSVLGHSAPGRHTPPAKPTAVKPPVTRPPGTKPPVVQAGRNLHPTKIEPKTPATLTPVPAPAATTPTPAPTPTSPPPAAEEKKPTGSGLPLPRFAALRSDEVFLRVGPGTRYPVDWVYHRRDLPVEIEREFEVWRLIEDQDGTKGWVHQATLTGRRSFVVKGAERTLRKSASDDAPAVALLKPGVVGRIRGCEAGKTWCDMQVGEYRGWLRRDEVWGTYPGEAVTP